MPYEQQISRQNPGCFLFLVDQSGSMADQFGSGELQQSKSEILADVLNRTLANLVIKCSKGDEVRPYFFVNIIGYGANTGKLFTDNSSNLDLVPINLIADSPIRIEERSQKTPDGAGGLVESTIKFPIWLDPVANNGTPMCQALSMAKIILENWVQQHPDSFPPIVINITDGESTDGNPLEVANQILNLCNNDGNVLMFNVHLSSFRSTPLEFPDSENILPDQFAKLLFSISSRLPQHIREAAIQEKYNVTEAARGFTFNADPIALIRFLDIGTRPSNLR